MNTTSSGSPGQVNKTREISSRNSPGGQEKSNIAGKAGIQGNKGPNQVVEGRHSKTYSVNTRRSKRNSSECSTSGTRTCQMLSAVAFS